MTTPSDLTTLELVRELTLARAWMQDTHAQLPMAAAARYVAIQAEAAERFKNSWIMTGEKAEELAVIPKEWIKGGWNPKTEGLEVKPAPQYQPPPNIAPGDDRPRITCEKHHLTFDFPNQGPTARDL